jgi:23S rRNA pseudouridine2604 synthase
MGFRRKLKYYLVHRLRLSNREAQRMIDSGELKIGGRAVDTNDLYDGSEELSFRGEVLQPALRHRTILYYKPRGIETTMNPEIQGNLYTALGAAVQGLSYAGRLDKESEGLLLLSSDGGLIHALSNPGAEKEKEYIVTIDRGPDEAFLRHMREGVTILGGRTRPCTIELYGPCMFRIVLTEGRNRQIRRMCYKLGYEVVALKRIRIDRFELGELEPGRYRDISNEM